MMRKEQLDQQLATYAGFLDEVSRNRLPDLTLNPSEIEGEVTVVELMTNKPGLDESNQEESRGFGGKVPWMVAIAAAFILIATVAFLVPRGDEGSLRTTEIPDSGELPDPSQIPLPVEPTPGEGAELVSVAALLEEATALESSDLLREIYSPDVAVTVDGFEFETPGGFEFATDTAMSELVDARLVNCTETASGGVETMACDWSLDFTLLAGTVPAQQGTATMTMREGVITSLDMVSSNFDQVVSDLSLYRGWVEAGSESADELFTEFGTLLLRDEIADRHRVAAADFLEATDLASDPTKIGNVLMAALRAGDLATVEDLFGPTSTWTEPLFTLTGVEIYGALGGEAALGRDLANFDISDCTASDPVVSCDLLLTYPSIPGFGDTAGNLEIAAEGSEITAVTIAFNEPDYSELGARVLEYRDYISSIQPALLAPMFINEQLLHLNPQSLALHDQYGPEWSAQISG
ncbi:MAG: hypothetical protein R8J94_20380 [Acidimicrobiia bacterium]|nr:hypothetical protein [Acidimicrobiia bacterium]